LPVDQYHGRTAERYSYAVLKIQDHQPSSTRKPKIRCPNHTRQQKHDVQTVPGNAAVLRLRRPGGLAATVVGGRLDQLRDASRRHPGGNGRLPEHSERHNFRFGNIDGAQRG